MNVGARIVKRLARGYKATKEKAPTALPPKALPVEAIKAAEAAKHEAAKPLEITLIPKEEAKKEIGGFEIPIFQPARVKIGKIKPEEEKEIIELTYPLIPKRPAKGEPIFAYVRVFWDSKSNRYVYQIVEPKMSEKLRGVLKRVKDLLEERLDVDFSKLKRFEAKEYLDKQIKELINYFGFKISEDEREILRYYIERDFIGLAKLEPMMSDDEIEDISCDGLDIPLFVFHRNPKLGSMVTNIAYKNPDELDSFITRLAQLCGKSISVAMPLVDGSLPDGSRLQATLATDIARKGSNFTIRKFTKTPLTPVHLMNYGTVDVRSLAYLWLVVDLGGSMLISGGTATGKTSLLNVLSLFIRPEKKIISIEDTAELRLPHPHWVPTVARVAIAVEKKVGEIDLFDLLKESFRQRPDYIIVGEVRGREAYILFQQIATGHPSLATIHSENMPKLMDRLTTPPISLPPALIGSLDLIVFLSMMRYRERFVRRMNEVLEMIEFDPHVKRPTVNRVFKWNPVSDKIEVVGKSAKLKKIAERTGLTEKCIKDELERRMLVLNWMKEKNILDYRDVNKVVNMYYSFPQRLLSAILAGG